MFNDWLVKSVTSLALMFAVVLGAGTAASGQATPKAKAAAKAKGVLDLNKASAEELADTLPGVGPAIAKKIVDGRPYNSVDDLAKAGVPAKTIEGFRTMVTVSPPPAAPSEEKKASRKKAAETEPAPKEAKAPLDLNKASEAELADSLPGVGPATAKKIIAGRPYTAVDDLAKAGVSAKTIEGFRTMVFVGSPPAAAAAPAPTTATPAAPSPVAKKTTKSASAKASAAATKPGSGKLVNLNTAPKEELDSLPGIGLVKAQAIIDGRPFKSIEDVMKVKGIKEGEFSKIKELIAVQ